MAIIMNGLLLETLKTGALEAGLEFTPHQLNQFQEYYQYLITVNRQMNLTAIVKPEEVAVKHFLDAITCFNFMELNKSKVIDIGSGAGFPGMVLKLYHSDLVITLVDSLQKRVKFLNELITKLNLKDIQAIHERAEVLGQNDQHREKYDWAVSRAVTNLATLAEYCLPLVKIGGSFIAMKGLKTLTEINQAEGAIEKLGGKIETIKQIRLPVTKDERVLIKINKVTSTPAKYPRRTGIPEKKPLI